MKGGRSTDPLLPAVPDSVELMVEIGVMPRQCFPLGLPGTTAPLR